VAQATNTTALQVSEPNVYIEESEENRLQRRCGKGSELFSTTAVGGAMKHTAAEVNNTSIQKHERGNLAQRLGLAGRLQAARHHMRGKAARSNRKSQRAGSREELHVSHRNDTLCSATKDQVMLRADWRPPQCGSDIKRGSHARAETTNCTTSNVHNVRVMKRKGDEVSAP